MTALLVNDWPWPCTVGLAYLWALVCLCLAFAAWWEFWQSGVVLVVGWVLSWTRRAFGLHEGD